MDKVEVSSIRVRTAPFRESTAGKAIIVSVRLPDGREVDVIEEFGAIMDIEIDHTVTAGGIEARTRE